jgi:hypothetical protein
MYRALPPLRRGLRKTLISLAVNALTRAKFPEEGSISTIWRLIDI